MLDTDRDAPTGTDAPTGAHGPSFAAAFTESGAAVVPAAVLSRAGLRADGPLTVRVLGPGRVVLERPVDAISEFTGALSGLYRERDGCGWASWR